MDMNEEVWLPVQGRESFYEVSNTGKVRSLVQRYKTKGIYELKQTADSRGYLSLDLAVPSLKKELVHRLVAAAFCPQGPGCDVVNHIDNNPSNNRSDNLEWTTTSGNLRHAQKQGRLFNAQSKGGKVTGSRSTAKLFRDAEAMVGNVYGEWTVLSTGTVKKYGKANRPQLVCKCSCGAVHEVCKIQLSTGSSTSCKKCSAQALSKRVMHDIVISYTGRVVAHWKFTGQSNIDVASTTKKLYLEALCTHCNAVQGLNYSSLGTSKLTCKNCKHKDIV